MSNIGYKPIKFKKQVLPGFDFFDFSELLIDCPAVPLFNNACFSSNIFFSFYHINYILI